MSRTLFLNLPVRSIDASRDFFTALGFDVNPRFSDDNALCLVVAGNIYVMLLREPFFQTFVNGRVADAHDVTEVLTSLTCDSREEVCDLVARALQAGGKPWKDPIQQGGTYGHSFQDLDGHVWELMYMEVAQ